MIPLMPIERRWLRAILDTIFPGPSRGELPLGATDLDVDGFFDELFAQVPFESSLGLRAAIWFLGLSPLFALRRLTTFDGLSIEERERVYVRLSYSPIYVVRSLVIALKAIGSILYCGNPVVRAKVIGPAAASERPLIALRTREAGSKDTVGTVTNREERHEYA